MDSRGTNRFHIHFRLAICQLTSQWLDLRWWTGPLRHLAIWNTYPSNPKYWFTLFTEHLEWFLDSDFRRDVLINCCKFVPQKYWCARALSWHACPAFFLAQDRDCISQGWNRYKESSSPCYSCDLRYRMVQKIPASFSKVVPEAPSHTPDSDVCSPESTRSFGCDRPMSSCGPVHDRMIKRMFLRGFLRENGFKEGDLYSARPGGCFFKRESLCPIHVAAMKGDYDVVKLLLAENADPQKETSRGRTAIDCALAEDLCGSNKRVVRLLQKHLLRKKLDL